jgi:hypothetical protein
MENVRAIVFALLAAILLVACTPSPEKVCSHVMLLEQKEDANHPTPFASLEECVEQVQKTKDRHPERWADCASCAMIAQSKKDIEDCRACRGD